MHFSDNDILVIMGCLSIICLLVALAYLSFTGDWMESKLLAAACDQFGGQSESDTA